MKERHPNASSPPIAWCISNPSNTQILLLLPRTLSSYERVAAALLQAADADAHVGARFMLLSSFHPACVELHRHAAVQVGPIAWFHHPRPDLHADSYGVVYI